MLSPKRTKFRKVQKGRIKGKAARGNKITKGEFGIVALEPTWITANQIEATRVTLSRYTKKVGKVYRQDLMYIFTTMIISFLAKQPTGDEFTNLCKYYAGLNDMSAAGKMFGMITKKFMDMNEEFGDIDPDKNTYQDGLNVLIKAYPNWENASFD